MKPKNHPARKAARQIAALNRPDWRRDDTISPDNALDSAERRAALVKQNPRDIRTKKNRSHRAKLARNPRSQGGA